MDLAAGSFVLRAVKTAYDLWRENKGDAALPLSDDAKEVLRAMQSDPTDNGIFVDSTSLADRGYSLLCTHHDIRISTTHRVIAELEAKGLVVTVQEDRDTFRQEYVKLTHAGWILNPQTGKADKVG